MKKLLILLLLLLPIEAKADQIHFTATTCTECWPWAHVLPDIQMTADFTVALTTGMFWDPYYGALFQRTAWKITDLVGTLTVDCRGANNCTDSGTYALSFVSGGFGDGWYFSADLRPWLLAFKAIGPIVTGTTIIYDHAYFLMQGNMGMVPLNYTAILAVPEPNVVLTLLGGLFLLLRLKNVYK